MSEIDKDLFLKNHTEWIKKFPQGFKYSDSATYQTFYHRDGDLVIIAEKSTQPYIPGVQYAYKAVWYSKDGIKIAADRESILSFLEDGAARPGNHTIVDAAEMHLIITARRMARATALLNQNVNQG